MDVSRSWFRPRSHPVIYVLELGGTKLIPILSEDSGNVASGGYLTSGSVVDRTTTLYPRNQGFTCSASTRSSERGGRAESQEFSLQIRVAGLLHEHEFRALTQMGRDSFD
jgi:hypothetical protein